MKKNFKFLVFFAALFFTGITTFAQGVVKGKLVDKETGETLIGASIYLESDKNVGVATNLDGTFALNLNKGGHLVINYVGYIEKKIKVKAEDTDLGTIEMTPSSVGISEVSIIASVAVDRHTPVAVSTIKPAVIDAKLGSQEFPEILKSTPGIYTTRQGGGFGDSRINVRGFDMRNTAILINGIPVNDMENGWVYWSNWASLSEVTRDIQVQRGLGASKLSIGSTGGTINYITKSADVEKGGSIYTGIGNDGYRKTSVTLSTGLLENGWAVTASGARTAGKGWVDATQFESWSYFLNISKRWNNQSLSFTAFGAPQTHGQRSSRQSILKIKDPNVGFRYNPDWGYRDGQIQNLRFNFYHKPQMSLNHFVELGSKTKIVSSAYASFGSGGGTGGYGSEDDKFYNYYKDGQIDFDRIVAENIANGAKGSSAILRSSRNDHSWYGLLSNIQYKLNDNFDFTAGIDLRYYQGRHYREVRDLLGGNFVFDKKDKNNPNKIARVGDKINYHNYGDVMWGGVFLQGEYTLNNFSAFLSGSVSNTSYRRTDFFNYLNSDPEQQSKWVQHQGFVVKGGANYNISRMHNIFFNAGYFEKAPTFDAVFYDHNTNSINEGVENEKVVSFELGYGLRASNFSANLNGYVTNWRDKFLRTSVQNPVTKKYINANITGVNALHMGVELDFVWEPVDKLQLTGMLSLGNYTWQNNIKDVVLYDDELIARDTINIYMKGLKVGDAAQTTMAIGAKYEVFKGLRIGADFNYFNNYYAQFDPTGRRTKDKEGKNSWKVPDYGLVDIFVNYKFKIGKLDASIYGNVFNLLNTEYISDAVDGKGSDWKTAKVFYGIGRTFTTGIRVNF